MSPSYPPHDPGRPCRPREPDDPFADFPPYEGEAVRHHRRPGPTPSLAPTLVFAPLAWLKLQFFLHAGDTEVGGFGVSSAADLLYVQDFVTVKQQVTPASVEFEDRAVADYADACVDAGLEPRQFMRIWAHTHPGDRPLPSWTDEETFSRVFGGCDWSVMFILAKGGDAYARLAFSAGPAGNLLLPVTVDWDEARRVGHAVTEQPLAGGSIKLTIHVGGSIGGAP